MRSNEFQPTQPDALGFFGEFGGRFVPESLMEALLRLERDYLQARADLNFQAELSSFLKGFVGRPSPIYFAERLSRLAGGARIYLKREDLNHTGSHKINNCAGQVLLALRSGKKRVIAETGAGQHGVAVATVCARFNLPCTVFMGACDIERQALNVSRMQLLGAEVREVRQGSATLKDAMNEAFREWSADSETTHYMVGSAAGPHPYPLIVRDFQATIGHEARVQMIEDTGRLPDAIVAALGGGSNSIGIFHPFLTDHDVELVAVEAAGSTLESDRHAAALHKGRAGVLHGARTLFLQDEEGQVQEAVWISAGLDYRGVGPEITALVSLGRVRVAAATDPQAAKAVETFPRLRRTYH